MVISVATVADWEECFRKSVFQEVCNEMQWKLSTLITTTALKLEKGGANPPHVYADCWYQQLVLFQLPRHRCYTRPQVSGSSRWDGCLKSLPCRKQHAWAELSNQNSHWLCTLHPTVWKSLALLHEIRRPKCEISAYFLPGVSNGVHSSDKPS